MIIMTRSGARAGESRKTQCSPNIAVINNTIKRNDKSQANNVKCFEKKLTMLSMSSSISSSISSSNANMNSTMNSTMNPKKDSILVHSFFGDSCLGSPGAFEDGGEHV